jgi:peptidoglycan/LPS O-acetylase OafA/YrhL
MRHIVAFDYLKGLAIICVVGGHTTLMFAHQPTYLIIDTFIRSLGLPCLPVFYFIAGYFLAYKREPKFWPFYRKKITHIYLPTIAWIIFMLVLTLVWGRQDSSEWSTEGLVRNVLLVQYGWQYYFTLVIMFLYLVFYFVAGADNNRLRKLVWIFFVINILAFPVYNYIHWPEGFKAVLLAIIHSNPTFFFIFGMYVMRTDPEMNGGLFKFFSEHLRLGFILLLALIALVNVEAWMFFRQGILSISAFLCQIVGLIGWILFFKTIRGENAVTRGLRVLGKYSLVIYLLHIPLVPKLVGPEFLMNMERSHYYLNVLLLWLLEITIPLLIVGAIILVRNVLATSSVRRFLNFPALR